MENTHTPFKRVIQLELNELSEEIMNRLISEGQLPNFTKLRETCVLTHTESEQKQEELEPWIQWPTVHTGKTYAEHGVFHLGDAHKMDAPQIWESLSENGIDSAVISPMNATRGNTRGGIFISDPWAKENNSHPEQFHNFHTALARCVQQHADQSPSFGDMMNIARTCHSYKIPVSLLTKVGWQFVSQKLDPSKKWRLAAYFDQWLTAIFTTILESEEYRFNSLFLNSVAHYQHHFWRQQEGERQRFNSGISCPDCGPDDDPVTFGWIEMDKAIGRILPLIREDDLLIVTTALSQEAYLTEEEQGGLNHYRLKDHGAFAGEIGIDPQLAFPLMSRDWQVKATGGEEETDKLEELLLSVNVNGDTLFDTHRDTEGYVFMETALTRQVDPDAMVKSGEKEIGRFGDLFNRIGVRSGVHCARGMLFTNRNVTGGESTIPVGQIFDIGLNALGVETPNSNIALTKSPREIALV